MGRGIRHSKNKKRQATRERPPQERKPGQGQGSGYKDIVRDNPLFDSFYRAQVPSYYKVVFRSILLPFGFCIKLRHFGSSKVRNYLVIYKPGHSFWGWDRDMFVCCSGLLDTGQVMFEDEKYQVKYTVNHFQFSIHFSY